MTDEQRKALVQDYRVYAKMKPFPGPYITAADQIEADGKHIEAQAAEIERLCSVINATAFHWMALQDKHPLNWEGAIDGAMAAACAEIVKLHEALRDVTPPPHFGESEQNKAWWAKARAALGETK